MVRFAAQRIFSRSRAWHLFIGAAFSAACGDSTPPLTPKTIELSQTTVALDAIGATQTITATVKDQNGDVMPTAKITWATSAPSVTIAAVAGVSPDVSDIALATTGTPITGTSIIVTAATKGAAVITATAGSVNSPINVDVTQVPVALPAVAGDQQTGTVGTLLPTAVRVKAQDRLGLPIVGQSVTFVITKGGGSLSRQNAVTAADGTASSDWTLGTVSGTHEVTATIQGAPAPVVLTATAQAGPPATVAANSATDQTATAGLPVPTPPSVRVRDTYGNPVPGVTVAFAATGGGAVMSPSAVTDDAGIATMGWDLAPVVGANGLTATVTGLTAVSFTATGVAGPPASITAQAGNNQTARFGTSLVTSPTVLVADQFGNPVSGVTITFTVTGGGGSISSPSGTTGANGLAAGGAWALGGTPGVNTMTVTATSASIPGSPVLFTAFAIADYNISLRFLSVMSPSQQAAFNNAAGRWSTIVTGDLSDLPVAIPSAQCGSNTPAMSEVIDDIVIFATIAPIDGVGGILGSAGPCFIRSSNRLTIIGDMLFDIADVATLEAEGQLTSVVLHEMGHVLGIGSLWRAPQLANVSPVGGPPNDTHFNGTNAVGGFFAVGGASYPGLKVPVENMFGSGTINSHWRESVMANELMTGFLNAGPNPLSQVSVRSLQDLGYTVNVAGADAYTFGASLRSPVPGRQFLLDKDLRSGPVFEIDAAGRITRIK